MIISHLIGHSLNQEEKKKCSHVLTSTEEWILIVIAYMRNDQLHILNHVLQYWISFIHSQTKLYLGLLQELLSLFCIKNQHFVIPFAPLTYKYNLDWNRELRKLEVKVSSDYRCLATLSKKVHLSTGCNLYWRLVNYLNYHLLN